jgi:pimeloyl-ACP methyl ester carboxylesterase
MTYLQIAGAGHWVHLECKSKFLEMVAEFLETEPPKK